MRPVKYMSSLAPCLLAKPPIYSVVSNLRAAVAGSSSSFFGEGYDLVLDTRKESSNFDF